MKSGNKTVSYILKFLTSAVLTSAAYILINHYTEFLELTAGSYNIAMIFGEPLRSFLMILLLFVAGILAFITFIVKSAKRKENKALYPYYLMGMGGLCIVLPFISVCVISRFTGTLIYQTVSGIAIIANVVFMMISVCCGLIGAVDIIGCLFSSSEKENSRTLSAVILTGVPTGCALSALLTAALNSVIGISGVFIVSGILSIIVGIFNILFLKKKK